MAFNDNQLFYAALWWLHGLPGGQDHAASVVERYNKVPISFPEYPIERKPGKWEDLSDEEQAAFAEEYKDRSGKADMPEPSADLSDEARDFLARLEARLALADKFAEVAAAKINDPLPAEKLDIFFETVYSALKEKDSFENHYNGEVTPETYIELIQSPATSSTRPMYPEFPYSDELETAMAAAEIARGQMPQKTGLFLHGDGQLFVPDENSPKTRKLSPVNYPGQPDLPYRHIELEPSDLDHSKRLTWEELYRVVPLEPGQKFKYGWMTVAGNRYETERLAGELRGEDEVLTLGNHAVDDITLLETLTDEEIINFDARIRSLSAAPAEEYQEGYKCNFLDSKRYIAASDHPNIVRSITPDVAYMIVEDEAVQIGTASSFQIAQPGDFIIREKEGYLPRVMKKETVESGRVRFIFDDPEPQTSGPAQSPPPRPH